MPCGLCGDIIPTEIARCPACGAWARRRDFRALGIGVFMLLGFNAFMALGAGISLLRLLRPLSRMPRDSYDASVTGGTLVPYTDVFAISGVLAVITGALFLSWLWRAHGQAAGRRRHGRLWVIASWVVPGVNLWLPARLVHDVWMGSGRFRIIDRHRAGALVTAWWACLLASAGLAEAFRAGGTDTLRDAQQMVHLGIAAAACIALAATLCMAIVFQITRLQVEQPE
ncbi:DUF4328 domain-containing protein [Actinomadura scrupuli]|uniref:DUF4328 domain-containing protein n=1 Tax=Actinomadura scrupuli TaxID=559629 RepID=UPI003D97B70C